MRFGYTYKTSDAVWHEDEIDAKDREAVFTSLKSKGIRPIKVWEKESRRTYKRWVAIAVLSVAVVVLLTLWIKATRSSFVPAAVREVAIRHFIPGVDNTHNKMIRVFPRPSEAYLALYAMPAERVGAPQFTEILAADFADNLAKDVMTGENDTPGVLELRAVVAGMKEELTRYIRIGGGIRDYAKMLDARQKNEQDYRNRVIAEYERRAPGLKPQEVEKLKEKSNEQLRMMGMREMGVERK